MPTQENIKQTNGSGETKPEISQIVISCWIFFFHRFSVFLLRSLPPPYQCALFYFLILPNLVPGIYATDVYTHHSSVVFLLEHYGPPRDQVWAAHKSNVVCLLCLQFQCGHSANPVWSVHQSNVVCLIIQSGLSTNST